MIKISKIPFVFPGEPGPRPTSTVPWAKIHCNSLVVIPEDKATSSLVPTESGLIFSVSTRVLIRFVGYFAISPNPIDSEGFVSIGMDICSGDSFLVSTGSDLICTRTPTTSTLHDVVVWDRETIVGNMGISVTATLLAPPAGDT